MKLLRAIGAIGEPEVSAEMHGLMVDCAAQFIEAGGILTLDDWAMLTVAERAAFVAAGRGIAAKRAAEAGIATGGPSAAAAVLAPHDGGAATIQLALETAMDKAEKKRG